MLSCRRTDSDINRKWEAALTAVKSHDTKAKSCTKNYLRFKKLLKNVQQFYIDVFGLFQLVSFQLMFLGATSL